MKELHELKKKMMDELKDQAREVVKKPRMSTGDLDTINKLVKSIDRTCEIIESEDEDGYSEAGNWNANIRGNYGDSVSYRGRRRDSMGRYSRRGSYSRNGDEYTRDGVYSMDDGLVADLEEKMRMEHDPMVRDAMKRCISAMRG